MKKYIICLLILLLLIKSYPYIQNTINEKKDIISISINNPNLEKETIIKLKNLSKKNKKIIKILKESQKYPQELLDMLSKNPEMTDFVLDYPNKKGKTYSDNVGKIKKGEIPLLLQWDKRWGYSLYQDKILAINGCGPTSLSMVYTSLTNNNKMTPDKIALFSVENGYYTKEGTSWYLMTEGAKKLGLKVQELTLSKSLIFTTLENGHPIICSMRKGDFTSSGHFIVLTSLKNGKIKVNDPNSIKRSNTLWSYEVLEPQIKNLWSYSV